AGLAVGGRFGDRGDTGQAGERIPRLDLPGERSPHHRRAGQPAAQLRGGPFGHDRAAVDVQDAVADRVHLRKDVRGKEDRAFAAEQADRLPDLDDLHRVEPDGRLVENENGRTV